MTFPGIQANSQYIGENASRLPLPLKAKSSSLQLSPSTSGRFVKCEYYIMVSPVFSGFCVNNGQSFAVKLNIMQPGVIMPKIEEPQNWNPEKFKKS